MAVTPNLSQKFCFKVKKGEFGILIPIGKLSLDSSLVLGKIAVDIHVVTQPFFSLRFQLNLLLQKDPDFPPLANLGNNLTVLPIFWAQEGYEIPPPR